MPLVVPNMALQSSAPLPPSILKKSQKPETKKSGTKPPIVIPHQIRKTVNEVHERPF